MMKTLLAVSFASAAMAGGLVPFSAGSPAKADEVNRNFNYLDSAKAEKSAVDLLTSAVNAKAEKTALESLTKALDEKANASALSAKADTAVWKALRDSSGNLRSAIQKLPTSSIDTTAKRRIDSLAAATKSGDAGLTTRVSTVETNLANKVDKGTISATSIGALPASGASHKGALTTDGLLSKEGVRITGSDAAEPIIRLHRTDAPEGNRVWDWTTDKIGGSLFLRTIQDDEKGSDWAMKIDRKGLTPTAIHLFAPTNIKGIVTANAGVRIPLSQELKFGNEPDTDDPVITEVPKDGYYFEDSKAGDLALRHKGEYGRILLGAGFGNPMGQVIIDPKSVSIKGLVTASAAQITDLRVAGSLKTAPTEPWADYVFEPGYKPMALKEVEAFAKANGHLPEVPSAAEVQKDGIDLARMNAILLKKIEELTLHAAEQERKMEAMQAEIREMKASR